LRRSSGSLAVAVARMQASSTLRRRLFLAIRLAVAAALIAALTRMIHPGDLSRARAMVERMRWALPLVLLPTLLAMTVDAWGWREILATLGRRVGWRRMLELRLSVEAIVLAMPGGSVAGEAAKVALLERRAEVPLVVGAASLALTKLQLIASDAVYLLLAAIGLTLGAGVGRTTLPTKLALAGAGLTALASVALGVVLSRSRAGMRLAQAVARLPSASIRDWMERRRGPFEELDRVTRGHFDSPPRTRLACFAPFLLEWLIEGAETWLILRCVGTSLGIGGTLALDGVGSLLRAVAIVVPAGLGIQDATQILLMRHLGVADPIATGAAFVFIKRAKEVFWIVIGLLFLAVRRDLWRRKLPSPGNTP
jgi:glycosyltransferase 2 family protein